MFSGMSKCNCMFQNSFEGDDTKCISFKQLRFQHNLLINALGTYFTDEFTGQMKSKTFVGFENGVFLD